MDRVEFKRGEIWVNLLSLHQREKWNAEVRHQRSEKDMENILHTDFYTFSDFLAASFNKKVAQDGEEYWTVLEREILSHG